MKKSPVDTPYVQSRFGLEPYDVTGPEACQFSAVDFDPSWMERDIGIYAFDRPPFGVATRGSAFAAGRKNDLAYREMTEHAGQMCQAMFERLHRDLLEMLSDPKGPEIGFAERHAAHFALLDAAPWTINSSLECVRKSDAEAKAELDESPAPR